MGNSYRGFLRSKLIPEKLIKKGVHQLITKQLTISKWKFNLFGVVLLSIGAVIGSYLTISKLLLPLVYASDTTSSWDFTIAGNYTLSDSTTVEISGSSARLKVQNYSSDANTALLLHLDESSGNPTDSSIYANSGTASNITYSSGNLNNAGTFNGTTSQISVADSASTSITGTNTIEAWTKLNASLSAGSTNQRQSIVDKGQYQLYYDNETGKITYELADSSSTAWTQAGGNEVNGGWDLDGHTEVPSMVAVGTDIYAGLGSGTGDAEVWKWNGTTWSKVGGDAVNSSWASQSFESVLSLATDGTTYVYAGTGLTAGDGEVWRYSIAGNTWTKIGGDSANSSWTGAAGIEGVYAMTYFGGNLYVGLGATTTTDSQVWKWSGSAWTQIATSTQIGTGYEIISAMTNDGTNLYIGTGNNAVNEADVWKYNGSSWTKIGGDGTSSSWNTNYEAVTSLTWMGTSLYAGIGLSATDGEVWIFNGTTWSQSGGDGLNSSWNTTYEAVYSLTNDGTNVYAGLGNTAGEDEVWKLTSGTWSKIGGDNVNSGWGASATHTIVQSMAYNGSTLFASHLSANAGLEGEIWSYNGSAWTRNAGNYVNNSWGFRGFQLIESMTVSGDYMYAGMGSTDAGNAVVLKYDGSTWTPIGGQGLNSSWAAETYEDVTSMISYNGNLYVGLGTTANDAEVWKWNGSTWSQIGGDSLKSGWGANFEEVSALAVDGTYLYAGIGNSATDAEVWRYSSGSDTWSKIGGDGANSSWNTTYDRVASLQLYQGSLYAGVGVSAGEAEVWKWNGSNAWTKVGGDTVNSSWDSTNYEQVDSMIEFNGKLYAGLGQSTGDAELWEYNGSSWTKVGGDDVNGSWSDGSYERVRSIAGYDGDLWVALGNSTNDGEIWRSRNGTWSQIGGDSLNSGWTNVAEEAMSFSIYKGKLYVGIGNTQNTDAAVWRYGNNRFLQSSTSSFDTSWHHIAATYNGTTMKIYIDGVEDTSTSASVTIEDTAHPLLIGAGYGGREAGKSQSKFAGQIDELRISDSARTTFNTSAYTAAAQTVQPTAAVMTSGIRVFDDFTVSETLNGGSINYRLSTDGGSTWKYYSGGAWTTSASTSQVNSASTIDTNIGTLTAGSGGILWQAVLDGDGTQQVTLNTVSIGGISDSTGPTAPDTLTSLSASAGSAITTNTWYAQTAPYFSWTGATDAGGSGVWGYYVYFGTDNTADPQTAGNFQTTSNYTASGLSSGSTYYLRIRSRDNAQNVSSIWDAFTYKFDSTTPTNPSTITISPAGYSANNDFTFSWPAGSDGASGISGYQYKTATASGSLADWSTITSSTSVNIPDAAYQADANTFYLRTVDTAGNISTEMSATYYYGGEGPSAPRFLAITPSSNTTNSFAPSWQVPLTYSGSSSEITYCYTVNTLPSADSCTFTSPGATSLSASAFATQVGLNTFYVVAKNPATAGGSINYGSYASATFTANTSAPGIPLTLEVGDISIKSSETWRLVLSWNAPTDVGSGVSTYKVYTSTDDETYTLLSSVTGLSYVATDLEQQEYFYKVKACDSVGNCGAFTSAVSDTPTGKYTEAAGLSSGPSVSGITTKKAKISWGTDREADSKIAYGTTSGTYFDSEPSSSTQTTDHAITLTNLTPGTTYYYKAKWTDEDGNTGVSSEKTFSTDPAPTVTDPKVKNAGLSTANVEFTVKGASKVKIYYGKTSAFGSLKEISTSTAETTYTATLEELEDGTKYFYKINTFDSETSEYEGSTLTFETLPRPKISGVRIQQVIGTAQPTVLVTWATNTETSSIITYYPENDLGAARDEVNIALTKDKHRVLIRGLLPQTNYVLIAKGRDQTGNEAKSEPQKFTTSTDTRPPQISGLKVEGTNIQKSDSSEQTSQIVVSWDTDEAATSQIEFGEGTGTSYSQKTQEDANMTFNHLVVISNLTPSKVYHLRVISRDKAGNIGNSVDTVTITPKQSDNAFDLVITNLREVFGFLGSATK